MPSFQLLTEYGFLTPSCITIKCLDKVLNCYQNRKRPGHFEGLLAVISKQAWPTYSYASEMKNTEWGLGFRLRLSDKYYYVYVI